MSTIAAPQATATETSSPGNVSSGSASSGSVSSGSASIGEAEFLRQEAERAKAAISESLGAIGKSLGRAADPHRLTKDHPWMAIGAAAVAGFAAASAFIPSKEQQAIKALAAIERSLRPPEEKEKASDKKSSSVSSGFLGVIFAELFKISRPLLTALITNAAASQPAAADEDHDGSAVKTADGASAVKDETPGISAPS